MFILTIVLTFQGLCGCKIIIILTDFISFAEQHEKVARKTIEIIALKSNKQSDATQTVFIEFISGI